MVKFKCPEQIEVVKEFPVTGVGKVNKPAMRQMLLQEAASPKL